MNASQDPDAAVTLVEDCVLALKTRTTQEGRADMIGLRCHTMVSKREQLLMTGQVEMLLDTYPARWLVRLGLSDPTLRETLRQIFAALPIDPITHGVEKSLKAFARTASAEVAAILGDLDDDALSPAEASAHDEALNDLQAQLHKLRCQLGRRARGVGRGAT